MIDKTLDGLRAARALIATPHAWTKGEYARTADGLLAAIEDDAAVCFCAAGAHRRVTRGVYAAGHVERGALRLNAAAKELPGGNGLIVFNDAPETTHADVLAVFDRAIELRRAELAEAA